MRKERVNRAIGRFATAFPREVCHTATDRFLTSDPATIEVLELVEQAAASDATILITGESGTGKELLARGIHSSGSRVEAPFVVVNCGAVPSTLFESELFGHVQGAFTGAERSRRGYFGAADQGTIFLDEVSEMAKPLQAGLLRVLQSGEYSPVGTSASLSCDVRVVSASNRNLLELVDSGAFRHDLYYRLNIITVEIPPLRERRGDIPLLTKHFLARFNRQHGRSVAMDEEFLDALCGCEFPGNVRELENAIQRAVVVSRGDRIGRAHLPRDLADRAPADACRPREAFHAAKARAIEQFERRYLVSALTRFGGIVTRAARDCGLSERNFHAKLKAYGISGKSFRSGSPVP